MLQITKKPIKKKLQTEEVEETEVQIKQDCNQMGTLKLSQFLFNS